MTDIAKKLRDMHALAGKGCDPEFSRALLDAAAKIDRLGAERDVWKKRAMEYGARLARSMSEKIAVDEQSPVPVEIRNDPSQCCKGLSMDDCSKVQWGECERD